MTTSPGTATAERSRLERETVAEFTSIVDDFLRRTLRSATDALTAPTLIAAGIPGMKQKGDVDPFAFTNIRKHWYDVVRDLATRRDDLVPAEVEAVLLDSSLPSDAFEAVSEILATSRTEEWTIYKTKRALSAHLIVKERPGTKADSDEHALYKNKVRRLARTAATLNYSRRQMRTFARDGYTHKKWIARMDDRTRHSHLRVNGTVVPLDAEFIVGGAPMAFPGDPTAPPSETVNCRCVLVGATSSITAGATIEDMSTAAFTTMTALDAEECQPCALAAETDPTPTDDSTRWAGVIGVEGEMTGDGRLIEANALNWETPIPLRYVSSDVGAHDGAQVVGRITAITRLDDGRLWGEGDFDAGSEHGREAARQVTEDLTNGISMDLDNVAFEVRVASEMVSEDTPQITLADDAGDDTDETTVATETDEHGRVTVQRISPDDEVRVTTSGRIRAATIVSIPAFESAKIHAATLASDDDDDDDLPQAPAEEDEPDEDVLLEDDDDSDLVEVVDALAEEDDTPDPEVNAADLDSFKNWVEKAGGLPRFIKRISKHLRRKGMTESHAIATAVNVVKKMCATGDLNYPGKQNANPASRARACAAVASWEAKKAKAKVTAGDTMTFKDDSDETADTTSVQGILDDLPRLSDEEEDKIEAVEESEIPNVLEGLASNESDEARKGALMEAAGKIRDLLGSDKDDGDKADGKPAFLAGATPLDDKRPPAAWFRDPGLTGPTALTVTDDGRVYGHLAAWDTCHTSHTSRGQCVRPPHSASDYAYFNTGSVVTDAGEVSAGRITLGTGHADETLNPTETMAHYEDTGTAVAWVRAGEDAYGIWVAGATRANLDEDQRTTLRATPLSGDWRRIGTSLELVAALAVNVPGFPVPRPKGMVASGHMTSLVASGMVAPTDEHHVIDDRLSDEDIEYLQRMARRAREQDAERAADLRRRVKTSTLGVKRMTMMTKEK